MERNDAARANAFGNLAEGFCRVFHEMQNEAAYRGVEEPRRLNRPHIRLPEFNVAESFCGAPLLG